MSKGQVGTSLLALLFFLLLLMALFSGPAA